MDMILVKMGEQRERQRALLSRTVRGDILSGTVSHNDDSGVYVDLGGDVPGFLPNSRLALSPLVLPRDFPAGTKLYCGVLEIVRHKRLILLTHRELLGTFEEVTGAIPPGDLLPAVACGRNLAALQPNLLVRLPKGSAYPAGTSLEVRIDGFDTVNCLALSTESRPARCGPAPQPFRYYQTEGRLSRWRYRSDFKEVDPFETDFQVPIPGSSCQRARELV